MPRTTIRSDDITDAQVKTADMAVDPTNASNLTSGSVPLAQLGNAPATDTTSIEDDIALLGFRIAANGSLAKYNLDDQIVDAFQDATGVDAAASTNEIFSSLKYFSGDADAPTGGLITTHGSYTVHSFLTTSNFIVNGTGSGTTVDYLVVGGGGSGGSSFPEGRFSSFTSWSSVSTLRRHPVTTSIITIVIMFFICLLSFSSVDLSTNQKYQRQ